MGGSGAVVLVVEPSPRGGVRVVAPQLGKPDHPWVAVARNHAALSRVVIDAINEAVASGVPPAITAEDVLSGSLASPAAAMHERRKSERADNYPVDAWQPLPGGAWRSPAARVFPAGTAMAANRRRKWLAAGLPLDVPGHPPPSPEELSNVH